MKLRFKNVDELDRWLEENLAYFETPEEAAAWLTQLTQENEIILNENTMDLDKLALMALRHFR